MLRVETSDPPWSQGAVFLFGKLCFLLYVFAYFALYSLSSSSIDVFAVSVLLATNGEGETK